MSLSRVDRLVLGGFVGVFGLFLGLVTTLHHRSVAPWGVVGVVALVAMWVVGLRLVSSSRGVPLVGVLAVLGAQLALSIGGGTSVVVAADLLGWVFTMGVVMVCLIILAWPDLRGDPRRYDEGRLGGRTDSP